MGSNASSSLPGWCPWRRLVLRLPLWLPPSRPQQLLLGHQQLLLEVLRLPLKLPDLLLLVLDPFLSLDVPACHTYDEMKAFESNAKRNDSLPSTPRYSSAHLQPFLLRDDSNQLRRKFLDLVLLEDRVEMKMIFKHNYLFPYLFAGMFLQSHVVFQQTEVSKNKNKNKVTDG